MKRMQQQQLTAEQKARLIITGDPYGEPHYQHEGSGVPRWITGGTLPDLHITLHRVGHALEVHCATCNERLGAVPINLGGETAALLGAMRASGHPHT